MLMLMVVSGVEGWGQSGPHTCATAVQFCSASGLELQYKYHTSFESGPDYGCLQSYMNIYNNPNTPRNVVWFYLKIKDPGLLILQMENNGLFPDYCCWGPFTSKPTKNQLTSNKIVVCDAANAQLKTCVINNVQINEYYIIAVTYYYNTNKKLIVDKIGGNATTYCPLEPVLNANQSILCEREPLVLSETAISDANQYNWTGPDGATYSGQVWDRSPATSSMSGKYNCVVIKGLEYGESTIDVLVATQPTVTLTADDTEICEGEEVTINANVIYNSPAPGDILCTDGSIVKPSEWPKPGKTAKGVVFYVDESGQHGWAVDKNITTCKAPNYYGETIVKWSSNNYSTKDIPGLINYTQWKDAMKDVDGYLNTRIIRAMTNNVESYPAAWSVDFEHGWYIPAAGQLNVLFGELYVVNTSLALSGIGGTQILSDGDIWSSTEFSSPDYTNVRAMKIQIDGEKSTGRIIHEEKKQKKTLRAVINF